MWLLSRVWPPLRWIAIAPLCNHRYLSGADFNPGPSQVGCRSREAKRLIPLTQILFPARRPYAPRRPRGTAVLRRRLGGAAPERSGRVRSGRGSGGGGGAPGEGRWFKVKVAPLPPDPRKASWPPARPSPRGWFSRRPGRCGQRGASWGRKRPGLPSLPRTRASLRGNAGRRQGRRRRPGGRLQLSCGSPGSAACWQAGDGREALCVCPGAPFIPPGWS